MPTKRATSLPDQRSRPQVLLLVESSRAYGRGCLMGIAAFLRTHTPWQVLHFERGFEQEVPLSILRQPFDGVISRMENETTAEKIRRLNIPTVDLLGAINEPWFVSFDTDANACGKLAFEHFRERGYRNFAYCGYDGIKFSDQRKASFATCCHGASIEPHIYSPLASQSESPDSPSSIIAREMQAEFPEADMIQWLAALPAPIGVFCCNDMRGRQVLQAGQLANRKIPEEIAVLGVDDDQMICELASPPLSSIEPDTYTIGFEASVVLDRWMKGESPARQQRVIPPRRVNVRRSTDLLAIEDNDVAKAVRFIHKYACDGIDVNAVAKEVKVSRVTLERRFRSLLNRSPRQEIERVRLERVRALLTQTNYTLMQIAVMTGYNSDAHMITVFRNQEGCTPGEYRKQFRR